MISSSLVSNTEFLGALIKKPDVTLSLHLQLFEINPKFKEIVNFYLVILYFSCVSDQNYRVLF